MAVRKRQPNIDEMKAEIKEEKRQCLSESSLDPLTWDTVSVGRFMDTESPTQEFLFENLIPKGIVGGVFATGGVGKSYLLFQIGVSLATGRPFGPFKPAKARTSVLYIAGEDSESILRHRWNAITDSMELSPGEMRSLRKKLAVVSSIGKIGQLVAPDGSPQFRTKYFEWLCESIKIFPRLKVLILDPMSRFFGLNENDNSHATAWIQAMEYLANSFDLTIIFAHHESKAALEQNPKDALGRGAIALRDGCRWTAGLGFMPEKIAKSRGLEARRFIQFDVSKTNYTEYQTSPFYFERTQHGVLKPYNLEEGRRRSIAMVLKSLVANLDEPLARWEIITGAGGKAIREKLNSSPGINKIIAKTDLPAAIDYALEKEWLREVQLPSKEKGKKKKTVLVVNDKA